MIRTTVAGLAVVLLLVTAGCVGGGGGATPVADASDGGGGGGERAAGGDGAGVTLVANRTAALVAAGSYSSVWRMRALEEGTVVGETRYVTAIDYPNERYSFEMTATNDGETRTDAASYYADGRIYQRMGADGGATYAATDAAFETVARPGRMAFVSAPGDLEGFTYAGTETYDGVAVKRYEMQTAAPWIAARRGQASDGEVRWTDFSYEVLVDEQGLVRSEHWRGTGVTDAGTHRTVEFTYELAGVGSTDVAEPPWLNEARAQVQARAQAQARAQV